METPATYWKRCSTCKKPLGFEERYYSCSVSTCNRKRTALAFCSVGCWEAHVPVMAHREAWAEERRSPTREQAAREEQGGGSERKSAKPQPVKAAPSKPELIVRRAGQTTAVPVQKPVQMPAHAPVQPAAHSAQPLRAAVPEDREILVVVSKVKSYIRDRSGMNTSDRVMELLSEYVRRCADIAVRNAATDERKTVLERDVPRLR